MKMCCYLKQSISFFASAVCPFAAKETNYAGPVAELTQHVAEKLQEQFVPNYGMHLPAEGRLNTSE